MSDLIKVQATPQFNWYTCWTSLGANGMPDKFIEEDLKQPDWIKISFKKDQKTSQDTLCPTRNNSDPSISSPSRFQTSSQRH